MPPGNGIIKPASPIPKPYNPFVGLGVEGSALPGQPAPYSPTPLPLPAPAAPAAPAPPPAFDFSTLVGTDPQYIRDKNVVEQQHNLNIQNLLNTFKQTAQGYQDNANAHGALFSGAAVNAQRAAGQQYADQSAQQAQNYGTAFSNTTGAAWQRLLGLYTPGGTSATGAPN